MIDLVARSVWSQLRLILRLGTVSLRPHAHETTVLSSGCTVTTESPFWTCESYSNTQCSTAHWNGVMYQGQSKVARLSPPSTGLALLVPKTSGSHRSPCTILAEIHNIIIVVSRTDMVCLHLCYGLSTYAYINSKYLKKKHHLVSIPNGTQILVSNHFLINTLILKKIRYLHFENQTS